ncbi:hypothetical protein ACN6K9_002100 [Streptomyces sp. SAS_267]|uniref:hypothetical protein n=1 Tax=Streptomyces sp. SAS_267 TaxID=3412750 RepID=UPI00403CDE8A
MVRSECAPGHRSFVPRAALASARSAGERERIGEAFSSGPETGQLVGAVAVRLGGLLAAALLRRAERADSAVAVPV